MNAKSIIETVLTEMPLYALRHQGLRALTPVVYSNVSWPYGLQILDRSTELKARVVAHVNIPGLRATKARELVEFPDWAKTEIEAERVSMDALRVEFPANSLLVGSPTVTKDGSTSWEDFTRPEGFKRGHAALYRRCKAVCDRVQTELNLNGVVSAAVSRVIEKATNELEAKYPGVTTREYIDRPETIEMLVEPSVMLRYLGGLKHIYIEDDANPSEVADEVTAFASMAGPGEKVVKLTGPKSRKAVVYILVGPGQRAELARVIQVIAKVKVKSRLGK